MNSTPSTRPVRLADKFFRDCFFSGLLWLLVGAGAGCESTGYYRQAVAGQVKILTGARSVKSLLADPGTPPELQSKLRLLLELRAFAAGELGLPTDGHYLSYTDLKRPHAVWTVQAAPEFSLQPKSWWYPVVGSATYRGYFSEAAARSYAARLAREQFDVVVDEVDAYSTLGWFQDPALNTFLKYPERDLARTIFHELGHQRLYIAGDTDFNEAFAVTVEKEGLRRWLLARGNTADFEKYQTGQSRKKQFIDLVIAARRQLAEVYGEAGGDTSATPKPDGEKRRQKADVLEKLRQDHAKLKEQWGGRSPYDDWFEEPLNNARLNTVATYFDLVPAFEQLLARNNGDLPRFYEAVRRLKRLSREQRHLELRAVMNR